MAKNKDIRPIETASAKAGILAHKAILWWLPLLYFLISSLFYLRTYDSAQVKISVLQMGGLALLVLWVARLLESGRAAFSREDVVCLSPFFVYLLVGILSFLHAPYHMASVDFFLRHMFFMTAALVVIYEFDHEGTDRLTRVLIWTAWVAVGYGMLQFIDERCFPAGVGAGIDPFIWRNAFGNRVFSTYGNPNFFADFLVIIFPILLTQYLKSRKWSLLPLLAMLVIELIGTDTKGAWVGFGITLFVFGVIALLYFGDLIARFKTAILSVAAAGVLTLAVMTISNSLHRLTSISFRLFTWEGTWEMIETQPWIGTGIGSFPPVYPAFRRPPIFHIEGKHNTETDHSEDEYLEELFDNGILGFGVFIWLILSTLVVGFRSLGQMTTVLKLKDGRPPPQAYDLTGYMVAFMGMLGHNFFDVSLRFVSSGVYLGLLSGMIVNLSRGKGLYELHGLRESAKDVSAAEPAGDGPSALKTLSEFLIWPARLAAWGGLLYVGFLIVSEFNGLQGPVDRLTMGGEALQWWLAWGVLLACVAGLTWVFVKLTAISENPAVALAVVLALKPLYVFWGYFKADIYHNVAIFYSKQSDWDHALQNYGIVHQLDPNFVMSLYFTGNVFNDRFNMDKIYNPMWGDKNGVARDDYERALEAYDEVRRLAPNYVQSHFQVGMLHLKRAQWELGHGHPEEAQKYFDRAMTRFRLYRQIDPVFEPTYYQMGQILMVEHRYADAAKVFADNIKADKCAVAPSLIADRKLRETILAYQEYTGDVTYGLADVLQMHNLLPKPSFSGLDAKIPYPVHLHESAPAYTNLANAYVMMREPLKAQAGYARALALDSNYTPARRNLEMLRAKGVGLMPGPAVPAVLPPSANP